MKTKTSVISTRDTENNVSLVKYLGSIINTRENENNEVTKRRQAANRIHYAVHTKFLENREGTTRTNISLYKSTYVLLLPYGQETLMEMKSQKDWDGK